MNLPWRSRRTPNSHQVRAHWWLLAAGLAVLATGLFALAPGRLLAPDLYAAPLGDSIAAVPAGVHDGGPGLAASTVGVQSVPARPRTIALTFDDGPDPRWTPELLAVLERHDVHATFFVLGDRVAAHPDVVRRIAQQGSELGVHGYSHADLGRVDPAQVAIELRATQLLIEGASGRTTSLFRPPFSSTPAAVDDATWRPLVIASDAGYLPVLTSSDSRDWESPTLDQFLVRAMPSTDRGEVFLMHDGGGDRATTVAALDRLLPMLKERGYRVGTVSDALGLVDANRPAQLINRLVGGGLVGALWSAVVVVKIVMVTMIAAGSLAVLRAIMLLVTAVRHRRLRGGAEWPAPQVGPVTVIVPAYNEAAGIEASVRSIMASTYPVEVVVVDDGSTDGTADLARGLGLPGVRVITQSNAGKPAALNAGLRLARTEVVVMVDGDTVFEPGTVDLLIRPFADPAVGAVSGNAKVANRGGFLGRWQHIEYVIGFNMDRRWYDVAGCMPTVPGAVGAFRRAALEQVGGVSSQTLAEDTDLTMAIGRAGWRVEYAEGARAWTETPATLQALWSQRYRWCYGTMQSMWKHRAGITQRGPGGTYARRGLAYMVIFQVLLPLLAPAVDVFAVYGLLALDPVLTLAVWGAFQLLDLVLALVAFRLDDESPRVLWVLPFTQFCYRQLLYLVVIQSLATAVAGTRLRWHRMERYGTFATPQTVPEREPAQ